MKYNGVEINHQWSKTSEFEEMFQNYIKKFIASDIKYFSALRPFYEIRVVQMFAKYKKYFSCFTSCNENFKRKNTITSPNPSLVRRGKTYLWCGKCPKCVFVFTLFSVFINKKELISIFGKNLFEDEKLLPIFRDLLGLGEIKPFDCVGTFEEMRLAFNLAKKRYKSSKVIKKLFPKIGKVSAQVLKTNTAPNIPERFKFLGIKNVLILGYGKEGKITEKYLKKKFPKIKIGIADKRISHDYLEKQKDFDLIIKTPGIPKKLVTRPYTTATNIFFSEIARMRRDGKNVITIGITGSKGKSTSASLLFSVLKDAGMDARLVGNIGKPMLEELLKPVNEGVIFVMELSSYQLDDIAFSPNIAIVLNLFPEHMPYHGGIENYYRAKKNIINFQKENGLFIYNGKDKIIQKWAKEFSFAKIPFNKIDISNGPKDLYLLGDHNKDNIKAVIAVADFFNIPRGKIEKAIRKFKPLPHRLEFVGEFKGIKFYDDSISTAPESAIAAIKSLKNIGVLILGGEDRGYDFGRLEKSICEYKIKNVILFPDTGKKILKSRKEFNVLETSSMNEAVKFAYKYASVGSICLLSPASPSYKLWNNFDFEERGDEFKKWVKRLG